jgi:hypothetical protein
MLLRLFTISSCLLATASAWTARTGSAVSSFGGSVLLVDRPTATETPQHALTMKKGKANVPPQMRSQYAKQQEMAAMRQKMIAASRPGPDGLPVFNLFVRTKRANVSSSSCDVDPWG